MEWDRSRDAPRSLGPPTEATRPHRLHCLGTWGFIANRAELARDLALPRSLGDRDLLLRCFAAWGSGAAQRIAGPFSWIVWDDRSRTLVAARDRIGVHPLFFAARGAEIHLAGRVEALLDGSTGRPAWNERALVAQVQGNPPPAGETFYVGIRQLEPGELLTATVDRIEVGRYWRLRSAPALLRLRSDDDYAAAYRGLLFTVAAEYAPEGAAGITLSGGLDSTSLAVALSRAMTASRLTAVRWVAPELPDADESERSSLVAARLGLADLTVRADLSWTLRGVALEPPRASPFLNFYDALWQETFDRARGRGLEILFTGASGDHLFGCGVSSYADLWLTGRWVHLSRQLRADPRYPRVLSLNTLRRAIASPIAHAWGPEWWRRRWAPPVPWLGERHRKRHRPAEPRASRRLLPGRQHRLEILRHRFLPHVMSHATAAAARSGVALRHPLLDHRLFEFAASLPADQGFRGGHEKTVVRNAFRGLLPTEVVEQRGKVVPTAISRRGLAEREQEKVWPLLRDMRTAALGVVDEGRLNEEYRNYLAGASRGGLFWHAITCEAWLREHFA